MERREPDRGDEEENVRFAKSDIHEEARGSWQRGRLWGWKPSKPSFDADIDVRWHQ